MPTTPPAPADPTTPCPRCGAPAVPAAPDAAPPAGLCGPCAAHHTLLHVDAIRWALADAGPGLLTDQTARTALAPIVARERLDWSRLLANWDLPWPDAYAPPVDPELPPDDDDGGAPGA